MTALAPPSPPVLRWAAWKYLAVARTAARQEWSGRGAWLARMGFYALILLIFSRLWAVVFDAGALAGHTPVDFVWYLALTEWVMLSAPPFYLEVEAEIRSGDIVHRLPRPISYLGAKLAEAAGTTALRMLTLGVAGLVFARALAGAWPDDPLVLVAAIPLGLLAAAVQVLCIAGIGLTALWIHDASPVYWIWQKCAFLLGGLMLPLEVYPDWLRTLAEWTPFAAIMHGVGRTAFALDPGLWLGTAGRLLGWGALAALVVTLLFRRGLRVLDVGGG